MKFRDEARKLRTTKKGNFQQEIKKFGFKHWNKINGSEVSQS